MENVLEMMNAPTNSEIPANTSMNISTNPSMPSMSVRASERMVSPVTASVPAAPAVASTGARLATRSDSATPGAA